MQFRFVAAAALPLALLAGCSSGGAAPKAQPVSQTENLPDLAGQTGGASHDYLGIYVEGQYKNNPVAQAKVFRKTVGRAPNIAKYFQDWNVPFPADWAKAAYSVGALPQLEWEPHGVGTIEAIAAGKSDAFIKAYAQQVKAANVPVVISFGHEMNGWWYEWGTKNTKAKTYVKAWRHLHDLFKQQGATKARWLWTPNVIYPMPNVKLRQYYPGNAYVDWVGVIGYYRNNQKTPTFNWIFGPTIKQIKTFTSKPILLSETAVQVGPNRNAKIKDMLTTVAKRKDIIGLIWFDMDKRKAEKADYRLEVNKSALKTFRALVTQYSFGRP